MRRRIHRRGLDGLQRRQAGPHQQGELLGVVAMGRDAGVGAEGDPDPARMGPAHHVQHLRPGLQGLGRLGRGEEIARPPGDPGDEIPRQQGRHQIGPLASEQPDRFVVQIGAVLDRVAARAQEGIDPVDPVGVRGHLASHPVRGADDGRQFLVRELLSQPRRRVRQHATGRRDLDDVGPRTDLQAYRPHAVLDARADALAGEQMHDVFAIAVDVAVTTVDRNRLARGDDPRSRHVAAPHRVAQAEDGLVRGTEIGHGREAGHEGAAREPRTGEGLVDIRLGDVLQTAVRVLLAGQVHMAVDQARQHERRPQIDDPALADKAVAHRDDPVPLDHESFIALHNAGRRIGQKPPDLDERRSLHRRNRSGCGSLCSNPRGGEQRHGGQQ